jgi:predicted nucleic acid-binding protein
VATYTALTDANVLYSIPVTDLILELAATGLFRVRWSEDIHDEWQRAVAEDRKDLPAELLARRRTQMDKHFLGANVTGFEPLIPCLDLPDPNDRHVLAAAIVGRADLIVTFNVKDFPDDKVAPFDIEVQHPDEFLNHQRTLHEPLFLQCAKAIRARLSKPKYSAEAYIENLRACGLQVIAAELSAAKALI